MRLGVAVAAILLVLCPGRVKPEVAESSSTGFTVKLALNIKGAPEEVYRRLIHVGDWWNPQHTFSGDSHNLSIEEKPMGCFCEKLPNQGAVRHMEVVYLVPGKSLVLSGALGPLQSLAATGSMTIQLSAAEGATKLAVGYALTRYLPPGMNTWAAPVDAVITEQVSRLKNFGVPVKPNVSKQR